MKAGGGGGGEGWGGYRHQVGGNMHTACLRGGATGSQGIVGCFRLGGA